MVRSGASAALLQMVLVGVAVGVGGLLAGQFGQLVPAGLLLLNAAFCADLGRGSLRLAGGWRAPRLDPWLLGAAAVAAPVCGYFAWDALRAFRGGEGPVALWLGLTSVAYPTHAGSLGVTAGIGPSRGASSWLRWRSHAAPAPGVRAPIDIRTGAYRIRAWGRPGS